MAVFDTFAGVEHCLFGFKLKHPDGWVGWEFPGGKHEPGESLDTTAVRETFEETGLIIKPWFLGTYVETDNYLCLCFAGIPIDGELRLKEPDKHREWTWFPCDKPPSPLIPYARDTIISMGTSPWIHLENSINRQSNNVSTDNNPSRWP